VWAAFQVRLALAERSLAPETECTMKVWKRLLGAVILFLALLYGGDYLLLRLRIAYPQVGKGIDTVTMERLYAIPLKSGKLEYELDPDQPEVTVPCVHSLFPHLGDPPCWYLQRKSDKPILMAIIPITRS
jgi:hypothetical protein